MLWVRVPPEAANFYLKNDCLEQVLFCCCCFVFLSISLRMIVYVYLYIHAPKSTQQNFFIYNNYVPYKTRSEKNKKEKNKNKSEILRKTNKIDPTILQNVKKFTCKIRIHNNYLTFKKLMFNACIYIYI